MREFARGAPFGWPPRDPDPADKIGSCRVGDYRRVLARWASNLGLGIGIPPCFGGWL